MISCSCFEVATFKSDIQKVTSFEAMPPRKDGLVGRGIDVSMEQRNEKRAVLRTGDNQVCADPHEDAMSDIALVPAGRAVVTTQCD